jgi:hypothetical protein
MTRFLQTIDGRRNINASGLGVRGYDGSTQPITEQGVNRDHKKIFLVPSMGDKTLLCAYDYAGPHGGIWLTQQGGDVIEFQSADEQTHFESCVDALTKTMRLKVNHRTYSVDYRLEEPSEGAMRVELVEEQSMGDLLNIWSDLEVV